MKGPLERLFTLSDIASMIHGRAWKGVEGRIFSSGESIRQHLLNKISRHERWHPEYVNPFPARGGYLGLGS